MDINLDKDVYVVCINDWLTESHKTMLIWELLQPGLFFEELGLMGVCVLEVCDIGLISGVRWLACGKDI